MPLAECGVNVSLCVSECEILCVCVTRDEAVVDCCAYMCVVCVKACECAMVRHITRRGLQDGVGSERQSDSQEAG